MNRNILNRSMFATGDEVKTLPLYASEDLTKVNFFKSLKKFKNLLKKFNLS